MAYCYEDRSLFLVKGMKRVRKLAKALAVFFVDISDSVRLRRSF